MWGLADTGRTASPRVSQLLDTVNYSPASEHTFPMQTVQCRAQTPITYFTGLLQSWVIFTCPNHPLPGARQLRTVSPQDLLKLLKLGKPNCWSVPSHRNHSKALPHVFPSLLPPDQIHCLPVWPCVAWLPPLGNCKKLSFPWQLSPDLLASPYLNDTKPSTFETLSLWVSVVDRIMASQTYPYPNPQNL